MKILIDMETTWIVSGGRNCPYQPSIIAFDYQYRCFRQFIQLRIMDQHLIIALAAIALLQITLVSKSIDVFQFITVSDAAEQISASLHPERWCIKNGFICFQQAVHLILLLGQFPGDEICDENICALIINIDDYSCNASFRLMKLFAS